uniref:Ig-like domain-containing protein n=1 Tax=Cacopsylla melanoneura TaxID=428564 RepID=A0A8D9ELF9_9HEMI
MKWLDIHTWIIQLTILLLHEIASPSRFEILQSRHDDDTINITCVANGVFPEPKVSLWKHTGPVNRTKVHAYTETAFRNGAYDITASVSLGDAEFSGPITFSCDLKIAAISKNFTVKTTFRPGSAMLTNYGSLSVRGGTGSQIPCSSMLLLLSITVVLRIVMTNNVCGHS